MPLSPRDLARIFYDLHFKTFKYRKRVFKTQNPDSPLINTSAWIGLGQYLDQNQINPTAYFSTLLKYRASAPSIERRYSGRWYAQVTAQNIHDRLVVKAQRQHGNAPDPEPATDRACVVQDVHSGLKLLLAAFAVHKCGLLARRAVAAVVPPVFFAVDVYWPSVAHLVPPAVSIRVGEAQRMLARNPELAKAATETYNGWHAFTS